MQGRSLSFGKAIHSQRKESAHLSVIYLQIELTCFWLSSSQRHVTLDGFDHATLQFLSPCWFLTRSLLQRI